MDRRRNPYVPGAGLQPPELAGRDRLLTDVSIDMDRVLAGRPAKGLILLGLRGVGKSETAKARGICQEFIRGAADSRFELRATISADFLPNGVGIRAESAL